MDLILGNTLHSIVLSHFIYLNVFVSLTYKTDPYSM